MRLSNTSMAATPSARHSPNTKRGANFSPKKAQSPIVTKTGAKFVSKVEFATEVYCRDQCQIDRSAEKNSPATASIRSCLLLGGRTFPGFFLHSNMANTHRNGSASKTRHAAVALGPTSL